MLTDYLKMLNKPIIPQLICLPMLLLIIWQLTSGIRVLLSSEKEVKSVRVPVIQQTSQVDMDKALHAAFFGEFVPKDLTPQTIKKSMLDMNVVGIIFAKDEKDSQVILKTATGEEKSFGVGSTLPGGAVIKRITSEGVVVNSNGELESLTFPKIELQFEKLPAPLAGEAR